MVRRISLEKIYDAKVGELNSFLGDLESELEKVCAPMKIVMQMSVCAEEIFVNVANYAYESNDGKVKISIITTNSSCEVIFKDEGIAFNPLEKEDPDITLSAEDRAIGGLGIYMVKKSMDEVSYDRINNQNILKIVKKW